MDIIIQFSTSNRSKNHLNRRSNCSCEDNVDEEEGTGGIVKIGDNSINKQWSYREMEIIISFNTLMDDVNVGNISTDNRMLWM